MVLQGDNLILASQSPRRRALLEQIGLSGFQICPPDVNEHVPLETTPETLVRLLSRKKALALGTRPQVVLAADTVVSLEGQILGKPCDAQDARTMLRSLSERVHQVWTGVTVTFAGQTVTGAERTDVWFRPLTDTEINDYVQTGEPLDKAGAYGIQGRGALLVRRIEGDYFNVVGLPLGLVSDLLRSMNIFL